MSDLRFKKITEYFFAPFNTFVYLNQDQILFIGDEKLRTELINALNQEALPLSHPNLKIEWGLEESESLKSAKGVFAPPGKDNSFIMAQIIRTPTQESEFPITEAVSDDFPANTLNFKNVRFYFNESGVGTCSAFVQFTKPEGLTILELEAVSEATNNLYKQYLDELCFQLTNTYIRTIRKLNIPHHRFAFLPEIEEVDKQAHFIPWTHRIYHIHDDSLFTLKNPGDPFKFLLTPSRQMDIKDYSIYDNRYIYFGWGHSIIFTASEEDGYSQTSTPVYDYVRLVEVAQAKWQFLDVLTDVVTYAAATFTRHFTQMNMKELQKGINEIRTFENAITQMLADYRDIKITFDTEKRILLNELHERWLTQEMYENLSINIDRITDVLGQLYQRQKEQQEEALNTIALLFTILGIVEVFGLAFTIINPAYPLSPTIQVVILSLGTLAMAMLIVLYLRYAGRG